MRAATRLGHRARVGLRLTAVSLILGLAAVSLSVLPGQVAGAAMDPVVSCTSNENIFNTGYDAATGGILSNGSRDANWQVAGPFDTPDGTNPPSAASPPPAGTTFKPANVGNLTPTAWSASPYGNAQWISQQTLASPRQPNVNGDWYYQYLFTLDPSVDPSTFSLDMDFLADNEVAEVYVNGVAQSSQTTGLPQAPSANDPYHYMGFNTANAAATTLDHDWQTGPNAMIVQIKSGYPYEGFDAQMRPSAICPVDLGVTKTATPTPYASGQRLTYTVTVTNGGPGDAAGVTVSDPLPAALAGAGFTWTCTATTGSSCTTSGSGAINDTVDVAASGTLVYTVTGTVPAAASGTLTNTVTVTPPSGTVDPSCTPSCSATNSNAPPTAALTIDKSSPTASYSAVGNTISYDFLVTNTGNVTLDGIIVNDTETAPATPANLSAVDCPDSSLAPKASETCTATYTVTQSDVENGSVTDSATASGTPPVGAAVVSPASTLTLLAAPVSKVVTSEQSGGAAVTSSGGAVTPGTGSLAFTGFGPALVWTGVVGAALITMGGLLLAAEVPRRRQRRGAALTLASTQDAGSAHP